MKDSAQSHYNLVLIKNSFLLVNTFSIPLPVKPSDKSYDDDHYYCCGTQQDALYEQFLQEYRGESDAETADECTGDDGKK